jgi:signal peptidase
MDGTDRQPGSITRLQTLPWQRIASMVGFALLLLVVIPFVVYAVPQVVGADASYVVLSGSMEPTISAGDVIIVSAVDPARIGAGDVITFEDDRDQPTTHRVIEVVERDGQREFRTKGDNNEDADPRPIGPDEVIGRIPSIGGALLVIPSVGRVIRFAGTSTGLLVFLVVPVVLLVLNEAYSIAVGTRSADATGESPGDDAAPADGAGGDAAGAVTLTGDQLRIGVVLLALLTVASGWIAFELRTVWSFVVAAALGAALAILGAMYFFGGGAATDAIESDENDHGDASTPDDQRADSDHDD